MIVEFIGSTGAGKTTLINEVYRGLEKTGRVRTSVDLATSLLGLKNVTNPTLQNLEQELISLPFFIGTLYKYNQYLRHTIKLFWRNSGFSMQTIHNLRSLERKIGIYEITKILGRDQVILVDEGPILALHMLVSAKNTFTVEEIARFADLLPLPDLVVYIRASVDALVERTVRRADPPRNVNLNNLAQVQDYLKRAVAMFDQLTEAENIRDRLVIVESVDMTGPEFNRVVARVHEEILTRAMFLQKKSL